MKILYKSLVLSIVLTVNIIISIEDTTSRTLYPHDAF